MKTLKQLQNDLLKVRKELEPVQIAYFEAETEEQEELLEIQKVQIDMMEDILQRVNQKELLEH